MVSAIVPARDEEGRIGATVKAIGSVPGVTQVIVVDDGSTDQTAREAESAGADVLQLPVNRGKGGAMNAGARASGGDVLLFLDADLGESALLAGDLLAPITSGQADMTIARFPVSAGRGGGFGLAVGLARAGIERFTGRVMQSPLSGQRAMRREVWEKVGGAAGGFGAEVALTIDALRAGYRVLEVPVNMTHRVTGRDWQGFRHRARQFIDIARALLERRSARA
jgi:glycosyltransferase involved in cell wall biosynthesis